MLEIKNLKVAEFASQDSLCFECSLWWGGKRIGAASDDGRGGMVRIDVLGPNGESYSERSGLNPDYDKFTAWVAKLPDDEYSYESDDGKTVTHKITQKPDYVIANAVGKAHTTKKVKAMLRRKVMFKKPDDDGVFEVPFKGRTPKFIVEMLKKRYGDEIVIYNDRPIGELVDALEPEVR